MYQADVRGSDADRLPFDRIIFEFTETESWTSLIFLQIITTYKEIGFKTA